ncbi:hypothetical protein [Methylomonas sp. AM2-LC]|uniref:hypothetical protein n=1 Tax=Methylomonas sp. AM2-LC TaxID=3153301 RepID=UPI0032649DDA
MNGVYKHILISFIAFSLPGILIAGTPLPIEPPPLLAHPLKAGNWIISYYQVPNEHTVTGNANFCVRTDNTWYLEPIANQDTEKHSVFTKKSFMFTQGGNGEWLIDANNVTFYASAHAHNIAAFTAIGQLYGDALISGRYVNYGPAGNAAKVVSGSFQAVYVAEECAF